MVMHKRCGSLKILQPALTWVVILHCVVKTWKMRMDVLRGHRQEKVVNLHVIFCQCCPTFSTPYFLATRFNSVCSEL